MKTWLAAASFGLALAAAVYVLAWPMYSAFGPDGSSTKRARLLEVNAAWALVPVMFPVLIAALPLLFRKQRVRIVATILMTAFSILGGMTIGLYYMPAAILMLFASLVPDSTNVRPGSYWASGGCS